MAPKRSATAPANGWQAPHSSIWMASARAKTSRPHPCADDIGVRNRPSAERGPKPSVLIRQPHTRITAGVRQVTKVEVGGLNSIGRSGRSRDWSLHWLLDD